MASNDIKVTFEIENINKIDCINKMCKHNMHRIGYFCCNLKLVNINEFGECGSKEVAID